MWESFRYAYQLNTGKTGGEAMVDYFDKLANGYEVDFGMEPSYGLQKMVRSVMHCPRPVWSNRSNCSTLTPPGPRDQVVKVEPSTLVVALANSFGGAYMIWPEDVLAAMDTLRARGGTAASLPGGFTYWAISAEGGVTSCVMNNDPARERELWMAAELKSILTDAGGARPVTAEEQAQALATANATAASR